MADVHALAREPGLLSKLGDDELEAAIRGFAELQERDRRENQIAFYEPVSDLAGTVHASRAGTVAIGGGNGSSKTECMLAEAVALATGALPLSVWGDLRPKFRGPIAARIVVESLTTVLEPIILPKLMWWKWTGAGEIGGAKGHWGWIPRNCLLKGSWEKSWSVKHRILTVLCRDPESPGKILGESTIQFMSVEQDASDFASGDFHLCCHDEPPTYAIWRENQARTMRVNGRMMLAMTWPDDPAIPVDWIFDEVYERGRAGSPQKSEDVDWFELDTRDNPHLDQDAVLRQMNNWDAVTRTVRISGQPIRFSNRIHPLFTDIDQWWCFACGQAVAAGQLTSGLPACVSCGGTDVAKFNHVREFEAQPSWPTVFLLDPHPRKPHMFCWVQVDPSDGWWLVAEGRTEGDPTDVRLLAEETEGWLGLNAGLRLMDPNMGRSPAAARRGVTWEDEFAAAGLPCDLADDSDVGRARINEYLRPDRHLMAPRLHFHARCLEAAFQIKRYTWDEYKQVGQKDLKQKPRDKYDDYPTMLKYLANAEPTFRMLRFGPEVLRRPGTRKGAY